MNLDGRPYRGLHSDDVLIGNLLSGQPPHARHLIDQPWRLACPDTQSGGFARLWQDPAGQLDGFAAWQTPWAALDVYVRAGQRRQDVLDAAVSWAGRLFAALDAERGRALPYWLECRSDDDDTPRLAASRGFTLCEDRYFSLAQPLDRLATPAPPPPGFAVRVLAGAAEAGACAAVHRAAFGSASPMTGAWRARTLRMPQYRAELDLVAVAADGRLAGYVLGWLDPVRGTGQVEPLGVHPDFTRMGIGNALLGEVLARFRALGATIAQVEAAHRDDAAIRAYQAAGFRVAHSVRAFGKLTDGAMITASADH
jgi:mycothiol synthase